MKLVDKLRSSQYHVKFKSSEYRNDPGVDLVYLEEQFDIEQVQDYAKIHGYDTIEVKMICTEVYHIED